MYCISRGDSGRINRVVSYHYDTEKHLYCIVFYSNTSCSHLSLLHPKKYIHTQNSHKVPNNNLQEPLKMLWYCFRLDYFQECNSQNWFSNLLKKPML